MAITLKPTVEWNIQSTQGLYLLPYRWLEYGIQHKHITINQDRFINSVQGNVYCSLMDEPSFHSCLQDSYGEYQDAIIVIDTHAKTYEPQFLCGHVEVEAHNDRILHLASLSYLLDESVNTQKTINHSYIQLLGGCGVTINHYVWNYFDSRLSAGSTFSKTVAKGFNDHSDDVILLAKQAEDAIFSE